MIARLDEIFDLQMGKTPSRSNADYWTDGQYDWVSIADLGTCQKYVEDTKEKISASAVQESGIKSVPANTVIMSFKLSLGKIAITQEPVYTNEAIMAFIPTGKYTVLHTERSVQPSDALSSLKGLFEFPQWIDYRYC